jgi:hypothetical protein
VVKNLGFSLIRTSPVQLNLLQMNDPPDIRVRLRRDAAGLSPRDIPLAIAVRDIYHRLRKNPDLVVENAYFVVGCKIPILTNIAGKGIARKKSD